ncbi:immune-associated nucleotide-binding protein 7-like [Thalassophryne amazonica]|uniref:immune-associated nucleotide-binding protein 7-like n=1 Tax=Thalassophryne amazonica TaxID=390379 RepID=UPI00147201AD|nr:immune-associated nucleotide-binding protein 7-like [Thalassophryne amazonica]
MECKCREDGDAGDAVAGLWLSSSGVRMGAFTVVGYLLYRFSQTLPALIRWPIRIFCSLTGLSTLWSWVGHLVGTIRGIQTLVKWLSRIWLFVLGCSSKLPQLFGAIPAHTGSKTSNLSCPIETELTLILLGPSGGGRTPLADTLLGCSVAQRQAATGPLMESSRRRAVVDGREITVIDTPDLLSLSLGHNKRAREALRSLQLSSPGPHAFLLVIPAPTHSTEVELNAAQAIQTILELFGLEVRQYIIPVVTHADCLGSRCSLNQLLEVDAGSLKTAMTLCGQMPEVVDNRPDRPLEAQTVMRRQLIDRVTEMKVLRGRFVHELQRRKDRLTEELLANMASTLARKLAHV